jgi:hypothetical protein
MESAPATTHREVLRSQQSREGANFRDQSAPCRQRMSNRTEKGLAAMSAGRWGDGSWRSQAVDWSDWFVCAGFSTVTSSLACSPALPGVQTLNGNRRDHALFAVPRLAANLLTLARARLLLCLGGWVSFDTPDDRPRLRGVGCCRLSETHGAIQIQSLTRASYP